MKAVAVKVPVADRSARELRLLKALEQEAQLDRQREEASVLVWEPRVWAQLLLIWTSHYPPSSP